MKINAVSNASSFSFKRPLVKYVGLSSLLIGSFFLGKCSGTQKEDLVHTYQREGSWFLKTQYSDLPLYSVDSSPQLGSVSYRLDGLLKESPRTLDIHINRLKQKYGVLDTSD